jgi:hypothetical protein
MVIDKFIPKKYLAKQEVCALEALFEEGGMSYHFTVLKNKGKKLDLVYKGVVKDKINLPKQILKGKIPVTLIVNGKGVITKKINLSQEIQQTLDELIEQNLPAINKEELFIQVFKQNDHTAFITLCRKDQINIILEDLRKNKYDIATVLIGIPSVMGLQPLWSSFNSISTSVHDVELSNEVIDTIKNGYEKKGNMLIEGLELEKEFTLGFGSGLAYLMQNRIAENVSEDLNRIVIAHEEKNKFRVLTLTSVAIAFLIAVTNVLFYTSYFDANNKLETELSVYQGKYDQINKLLSDYRGKKDLIEGAGILSKNRLSEYADRIGSTIPEEVILSQMYFNPKKQDEESKDSLVGFENKQLIIKGNCNKSLVVNEWLNVLKMQSFVKEVSLEKFSYNKEFILPNFEIKIVTN